MKICLFTYVNLQYFTSCELCGRLNLRNYTISFREVGDGKLKVKQTDENFTTGDINTSHCLYLLNPSVDLDNIFIGKSLFTCRI